VNRIAAQKAWKNVLVARSSVYHEAFRRRESKFHDAQNCFQAVERKMPIRLSLGSGSSHEGAKEVNILQIARQNRCTASPIGVSFPAIENLIGKGRQLLAPVLVKNHQLA
jgi:hypothetical protein